MRPDLAKFIHFGKNLEIFGSILKVYLLFGKVVNPLWDNMYSLGQIFIVVNGQILKNNLAIWSHCLVLIGVGSLMAFASNNPNSNPAKV